MKPEDLVTSCGAYCGNCARWTQHPALRDAAAMIAEIVDGHGFHRWMPREVKEFNYAQFRKGLEFLRKSDTWLVCRKACRENPAMARCRFRVCCERRGITMCFECERFPCEKVNKPMIERAKDYRRLGHKEWLRQLAEKAKQGFELHTHMCYEVSTGEFLPPKAKPRARKAAKRPI